MSELAALSIRRRLLVRCVMAVLVSGLVVHGCSAYLDVGLRRGSAGEDMLLIVLMTGAAGLCALRVMWVPQGRGAWAAIGGGLCAYAGAEVLYVNLLAASGEVASPSPVDSLYLCFYALEWLGFGLLVRDQVARFYPSMWLDGLVGALGGGAFVAAVVLHPVLRATEGSFAVVATNLAYPLSDLLLLALVVGVAALTGARPGRAWLLLGTGLALFVVADSLYLFQIASNTYVNGGQVDPLWAMAAVLIGVAAWQPAARREVRLDGWAVLAVPCAFAALSLGLLVYGNFTGLDTLATVLAAEALLCAGARAGLTFRETRLLAESRREALTDELTGLANRRRLRQGVQEAISHSSDTHALVLLDLDGFKELNDTLGHDAGDRLLKGVAARLAQAMPPESLLARPGGDEFAVLIAVRDGDEALRAAEDMRTVLAEPVRVDGISLIAAASFGVALTPHHASDPDQLFQRADVAMYQAKRQQRGCVLYEPRRDLHSRQKLALAGELRDGIPRGELELHYQPKADVRTGAIVGVEALVRWHHPSQGVVFPDVFLPIAEQVGLMRVLTREVIEQAIAQAAHWHRSGHHITVAVNLCPQDLLDLDLPGAVLASLDRWNLEPTYLQVEITEQTLMTDPQRAAGVLARLGALGIGRALDDFGTGFSSLAYLQRLHVDELKVDRSFVTEMTGDLSSAAIVRSVLDLARSLGLRTVAEGVETQTTKRQLLGLGCDQYQGYLLSRPLPAAELDLWLSQLREGGEVVAAGDSLPGLRGASPSRAPRRAPGPWCR